MRFLEYGFTAWIIITANFLLPRALPGDPLLYLTGEAAGDAAVTIDAAARERLRHAYGLDESLGTQYLHYLRGIAVGDLGQSLYFRIPVTQLIARTLPWTLVLAGGAFCLAVIIGAVLGAVSAWRRGGRSDGILTVSVMGLSAIPAFLLAVILQIIFGIKLGILPVSGGLTPYAAHEGFSSLAGDRLRYAVLPAAALTLSLIPEFFLLTRNTLIHVLGADFIFAARMKGFSPRRLIFFHAMPNALPPLCTHAATRMGLAAGGMIFVETVFSYPGMGELMFRSVSTHDYPVAQGVFLVIALTVLSANLIMDFLYPFLNPMIKSER